MSEEHACLVRARSDSENSAKLPGFGSIHRAMTYTDDRLNSTEGSGEPAAAATVTMATTAPENNAENESGELLDYNDSSVLEQFHEDALRQAGCGLAQLRVLIACSLAIAGASLEISAIPFILPSAEIELCILPHEKNWLVLISLVGSSLGGVGWGALGARLGRRRALLSCLAVNAVFATIAAFMPTYGTFMMARFCSAIGSGGILPLSYMYTCEVLPRERSGLAGLACAAAGGGGALLAAALAATVLPATGPTTLTENKEHFSAWHRYLLLCTLPIIASLVSMIWTQESPRYLLDVGREVDAMSVYQAIHSSNQLRICGYGSVAAANPDYRLGELSLPGKRRPPALHHYRHSVKMFWQAFFQLFSSTYRRTTLSYGGILVFTMAIQFYLSAYVPATVVRMEAEVFEASKKIIQNTTFENEYHNTTIQNIEFYNTTFVNSTYKDLLMSHVVFKNCTFFDVAFSNVKSSRTFFNGCLFVNSTLLLYFFLLIVWTVELWNSLQVFFLIIIIVIDTDMELGVEFDEWCVLNSTVIRGVKGGCARHADLTSRLGGIITEQTYVAHATFIASLLAPLPLRLRPHVVICAACIVLSPAIYIAQGETALYIVEAVYRVFTTVAFFGVALSVFQAYPANLRCSAHALMVGAAYIACTAARGAGSAAPPHHALLSAVLCAALGVAAVASAAARRVH